MMRESKPKELIKNSMPKAGPFYQNPRSTKYQPQGQLRSETELKKPQTLQITYDQPKVVNQKAFFHLHGDFSEYSNSETASEISLWKSCNLLGLLFLDC